MSTLHKTIYSCNEIPVKVPKAFFFIIFLILKSTWNYRRPQTAKAILRKSPEIKHCLYSQQILEKGAKNNQWEKDSLLNML